MDSERMENATEMEKPMENGTEIVQMENGKEHEECPIENGKDLMENGKDEERIEEVEDMKVEETVEEVEEKMDVETIENVVEKPVVENVVEKPVVENVVEKPVIENVVEKPVEVVAAVESPKVHPPEIIEKSCAKDVFCEKKTQKEIVPEQNGVKKVAMCTSMDADTVRAAYNDVRADNTDTQWAVFKFEGAKIVCSATGVEFEKFREQFSESERAFGYIRLQTGDELSKRQKFLFVTWVGPEVSVIKRAKMSTDKSVMKNIISNFAVELQLESLSEFDLPYFTEALNKAGGANYGTGVRD